MRDLLIAFIVFAGAISALRRPWVGVMLWTWLSLMSPHRYAYGFAYSAPLAAIAAAALLIGLLSTKDRRSPLKGTPVSFLVAFMVWMTLSWGFGLSPGDDYEQWKKVMKVFGMTLVALALLHSKRHVIALAWVSAGSIAILGVKGGIFTILTGGSYRVWGPPDTFIGDNNEFAVALIMTIPMLRFLQMQLTSVKGRSLLTAAMFLCAASALGSQSRGALLGISAMGFLLWWRGRSRVIGGLTMLLVAVALVALLPEEWGARMDTMNTYQDDRSAMGRISAWWTAWGIATHYPFGIGFNMVRPELFENFSPYPGLIQGAHSIYFLPLANHGFVGLGLFLGILISTWVLAGRIRKQAANCPEAKWVADLASMSQVSLLGFAVGGAFLNLTYYDGPYIIMMLVTIASQWLRTKAWLHESAQYGRWWGYLGLSTVQTRQN